MREVQDWIEAEMRRLDPQAYAGAAALPPSDGGPADGSALCAPQPACANAGLAENSDGGSSDSGGSGDGGGGDGGGGDGGGGD